MEESILITIKKLLGLDASYEGFDMDIVVHINSALNELSQIGVESCNGYMITDENDSWDDILPNTNNLELVKTYIYLYVRQIFDPPTTGIVADALKSSMDRLAWRINVEVDPGGINNA